MIAIRVSSNLYSFLLAVFLS